MTETKFLDVNKLQKPEHNMLVFFDYRFYRLFFNARNDIRYNPVSSTG